MMDEASRNLPVPGLESSANGEKDETSAREAVLQAARTFVQGDTAGNADGHDWPHVERVTALAVELAHREGAIRTFASWPPCSMTCLTKS